MVYDSTYQTVLGGYEDNEVVASHIWDSLVQDEQEHVLVEAGT